MPRMPHRIAPPFSESAVELALYKGFATHAVNCRNELKRIPESMRTQWSATARAFAAEARTHLHRAQTARLQEHWAALDRRATA